MNILLLIPSSKFTKTVIRDVLYGCWCCGSRIGGGQLPPLTLLSVATVLKQDGHSIRLLDSSVEDLSHEEIMKEIDIASAIVILTSTMTFIEDAAVLAEFKRIKPELKTVVFGAHPTFLPEDSLNFKGIDIIVKREPEFALRDLFRNLQNDDSWKKVKGIGYKDNGSVFINEDYPYIGDLDDLPIPDRALLPRVNYYNPIVLRTPYTTAETSRGCPGKCSFCTAPSMYGGRIRCRSSAKVTEEIEYLLGLGYKEIYYRDETWTTFKARNIQLLSEIIKRNYAFTWICNVRVGTVDKETLGLMKKAGCHMIKVGVESGSQRILDKSKKMVNVVDIELLFKWAREIGLDAHAHLMIGMPGEDKQSIEETIKFIKRINPTTIDMGICSPYPGTVLFEQVAQICPEIKDGTATSLENLHKISIFNKYYTSLNAEEIELSLRKIYRKFYLRPSYLFNSLMRVRTPKDLKKICLSGMKVIDFAIRGK